MKILCLSVICLIISTQSHAQFDMPSFKEVVQTFFTRYSFDSHESYLRFQRKIDGWYVSEDSYSNPGSYYNTSQFWSANSKSFLSLNYLPASEDSSTISETVTRYLNLINWTYEEYQFQRQKYYGYPAWAWDIIQEIPGEINGTDSVLESQGRAYSNYASGFITEQYGDLFVNNDPDRVALAPTDRISASRINKFIHYELKAIDAYKHIIRINPNYETKVGNIKIKCANEYMFMYCDLMMAGDSQKAKLFAKNADYPDSLLNIAKTYLSSVPTNGILITSGDNDTYPLWYLQEIHNYRPDVIVLNYSLLGLRRYISMLDLRYNNKLFSTQDTTYQKNNFDYFLFKNEKDLDLNIDVTRFLKDLHNNYNPYDSTEIYYKNELLKKYYSKRLFFSTKQGKKSNVFELKEYLLMNEIMTLDIINTNPNVSFSFDNDLLTGLLSKMDNVYKVDL